MKSKKLKKRPKRTDTKVYQSKQLKKLKNKCLKLWSAVVKAQAGYRCFVTGCEETKKLNAHHIEDFLMNPIIRYDPRNGLCCCPGHHKFKKEAVHRSFVSVYDYMVSERAFDIGYLEAKKMEDFGPEDLTKEYLENQIKILQGMMELLCTSATNVETTEN
jgi:predicted restriction endonuclease